MSEEISYADRIFSGIGGLLDGAKSIAGDVFEYKLLSQEIEAQQAGINTSNKQPTFATAPPVQNASVPVVDQSILTYGAIGLSVIATLFVLVKG
jgi:hypothetical protein